MISLCPAEGFDEIRYMNIGIYIYDQATGGIPKPKGFGDGLIQTSRTQVGRAMPAEYLEPRAYSLKPTAYKLQTTLAE